jgi:hypothetical protein
LSEEEDKTEAIMVHLVEELQKTDYALGSKTIIAAVKGLAGEKFFPKVKFMDKADSEVVNKLSKKCMKALGHDDDEWLAVWANTALPTIIKKISSKRSTLMQRLKITIIEGKSTAMMAQ